MLSINGRVLVVATTFSLLSFSTPFTAQAQWTIVGTLHTHIGQISDAPVTDIFFVSPSHGYYFFFSPMLSTSVPSQTSLLKTVNHGVTWNTSYNNYGPFHQKIMSASFAGPDIGYMIIETSMPYLIYKTNNAGLLWSYLANYQGIVSDICAIDSGLAYVTLGSFGFYTLTDSLRLVYSFSGSNIYKGKLHFLNASQGWVSANLNSSTGSYSALLHTDDGGVSWTSLYSDLSEPFYAYSFPTGSAGFLVADSGCVLVTTDSGTTWTRKYLPEPIKPVSLSFISPDKGFILGSNQELFRTNDGGNTWTMQVIPQGKYPWKVMMLNDTIAYLACIGLHNELLGTTNGGFANIQEREPLVNFQVIPNPAGGSCQVNLPQISVTNKPWTIQLLNNMGQVVTWCSQSPGTEPLSIDLSELSPGLYIISLTQGAQIFTEKLIHY